MPPVELDLEIVKTVVDRFFRLKESTPRGLLIRRFKSPEALYRLANASILKSYDLQGQAQEFLPTTLAFYYAGDQDIIRIARTSVEVVLHVLQNMFEVEMEKVDFTPSDVETHARKLYDVVDPNHIRLGLYLVRDFGALMGSGMNTQQTELVSLRIAENIVTIKDISKEWDAYIERSTMYDRTPEERSLEKPFLTNESSIESKAAAHSGLSIFISHSSKDADLALALVDLLKAGLAVTADRIRCSSVDGYRLPVGVNTEAKLREEVNAAQIVIGLITPSSLSSYYVMFELGARWGAKLFLAPLLAGVRASELSGPLSLLNALSASSEPQLHQLLADIAQQLRVPLQPTASYIRNISAVKALADAFANPPTITPLPAAIPQQRLRFTVSVSGNPPSQVLKITSNRAIEVSRVDYLLSSEATIAGEDVSVQGDSVEIPVNDQLLLQVWNTPRHDRNSFDHSGPAKIGITVSGDGESHQYILPVQMQATMLGNTMHRTLVGSKSFSERA